MSQCHIVTMSHLPPPTPLLGSPKGGKWGGGSKVVRGHVGVGGKWFGGTSGRVLIFCHTTTTRHQTKRTQALYVVDSK